MSSGQADEPGLFELDALQPCSSLKVKSSTRSHSYTRPLAYLITYFAARITFDVIQPSLWPHAVLGLQIL